MAIPDYRALGEARLKLAAEIKNPEEWQEKWPAPEHGFPWKWGACWKHMASYRVADLAAEAGFFIDILGMPVNAFGPDFMMVTGPEKEFYLGVYPASEGEGPTPPGAIGIEFMVEDIFGVVAKLEERGVEFEKPPTPVAEGAPLHSAECRTPNGIKVVLWGIAE